MLVHRAAKAADSMQSLDVRQVKVGGEIGRRIDVTIRNNLMVLNVDRDFIQPFKEEKEKREGEYIGLGKLIDAAVSFAAYSGDDRVKTLKEHLVSEAVATQEADGYIGTKPPGQRVFTLWDVHEMGYLVYGLTSDYRFFGEKRSLEAAKKLGDYIIRRWTAEPRRAPGAGQISSSPILFGALGIESAMLALHQQTNDKRYLDFVKKFCKLADWDAHIVTGRWGRIEGHAYAHICRCIAQLRLNRLQPGWKLLKPTRDVLDFLLRKDGMVITGECGDHECWHDTQEGTINLGETCATAYLVRWLDELLRMEGKSLFGDLMERVIYNGLFGAQSPDGRQIRYYTPFDGPRSYYGDEKYRYNEYTHCCPDTYCCPNNYRRIIAELPSMIFYRSAGGIAVNLYSSCEAKIGLEPELTVNIRQETDYPSSGHVVIHLDPSKAARFPLRLRMPRWCEQPVITINADPVAGTIKPGNFFVVTRKWQQGDRVELDLPMPVRLVKGRVAQAGRMAIMRGPQVYCLNRSRHKELANIDLRLLVIDPTSVEGPFKDELVRPGGASCRVLAWGPGAWYPDGVDEAHTKPNFTLELSEFPDPAGEFTYLKVPNPNADELVDDELMNTE